jgi:hypothetical protein
VEGSLTPMPICHWLRNRHTRHRNCRLTEAQSLTNGFRNQRSPQLAETVGLDRTSAHAAHNSQASRFAACWGANAALRKIGGMKRNG